MAPTEVPSGDQVRISKDSMAAATYVQQVKDMPETRQDVVRNFSRQVKEGMYPPPGITDGLLKLIGTLGG